jgi:hypothetical protein
MAAKTYTINTKHETQFREHLQRVGAKVDRICEYPPASGALEYWVTHKEDATCLIRMLAFYTHISNNKYQILY